MWVLGLCGNFNFYNIKLNCFTSIPKVPVAVIRDQNWLKFAENDTEFKYNFLWGINSLL